MKTRLSVDRDNIPDDALAMARSLYTTEGNTVEDHNKLIEMAVTKYGMATWFAAVEVVRQEGTYKEAVKNDV